MSKETVALEEKGIKFCNEILYSKMGWVIIERIKDKERQEIMGDVILLIDGFKLNIDEKTASYPHDDMIIELIQDAITNNGGWYYKLQKCHGLVYIYFKNGEVFIVYKVNMNGLRKMLSNITNWDKGKIKNATGGWGYTINLCYPWVDLVNNEVAEIIYKHEYKMTNEEMDIQYPEYAPYDEIPFEE